MIRSGALRSRQAGFTLIEVLISLVLLMVGLLIAAELLMETAQLFATTSRETTERPIPLAIARLRADVQGADSASPLFTEEGDLSGVLLTGPTQAVVYYKEDTKLMRRVDRGSFEVETPEVIWENVIGWQAEVNGGVLDLRIDYMLRGAPPSPLPGMPVDRVPGYEMRTERMFFLTRGSGLGASW
ncbi:MAG: prepilin-type N-terminal cleavage/methylation domain-containing protein [Thermoanaerobaculia bacterium]